MAKQDSLSEEYDIYLSNAVAFPGLLVLLQEVLGDNITLSAVEAAGIGFHPGRNAWVFPERNAAGKLVGFTFRNVETGNKMCVKGGKRGLTYEYNRNHVKNTESFRPGAHNWVRTSAVLPCPICKKDYCLLDRANPKDPAIVLCTRISKGSKRAVSTGWIHELKPGGDKCGTQTTALCDTDDPYLLVEGGSDPIAGRSIGLVTIGRPSNISGIADLRKILPRGHPVLVIGENDKQTNKLGKEIWPGYEGAVKTCMELRDVVPIKMLMPPDGIKDLRKWVNMGLTKEALLEYAEANAEGVSSMPDTVFETDDPLHLADKFLQARYTESDVLTLREYRGAWLGWTGHCYAEIPKPILRGSVYAFLEGKQAICNGPNGDPVVKPLKSSARRINDIHDAFTRWCPVPNDMPCWLDNVEGMPAVRSLVAFENGLLDVDEYCKGKLVMYDPDPRYFCSTVLPYEFNESAESPLAESFFLDVFEGDMERVRLIQQWFGYNLVPDTHMQKCMLMVGVPRSGKSTVIEMMENMVGKDQCCSIRFDNLATEFGRQPLLGKRCCFIGDTRSPGKGIAATCMEQLLRIIGEDTVGVNRKHRDEVDALLKVRFTFAMNELPFFIDNSNALVSRMLMLNFNKSYVGREDYSLRGRLSAEARQGKLMNWALRGLRDLRMQEKPRFIEPSIGRATIAEFTEMASPVTAFLDECCDLSADSRVASHKLFDVWKAWADRNGYQPGVQVHFGRKLTAASSGKISRCRMGATREHGYSGINVNKLAEDRYLGGT